MALKKPLLLAVLAVGLFAPPGANALSFNHGPFFVFFDSNSAELRTEGKEVLANAAKSYLATAEEMGLKIHLAGFSDRAGSSSYNSGLSGQRATSVRAYLIAQGVKPSNIANRAFGENPDHLRVATADGVTEQQNRRVEIYFDRPNENWLGIR